MLAASPLWTPRPKVACAVRVAAPSINSRRAMCPMREGDCRGVPIRRSDRLCAHALSAQGFWSGAGATSTAATDMSAVCAAKPDQTCGARLDGTQALTVMSDAEGDMTRHYEEALIGLDDIVDDVGEVVWKFNAFTDQKLKQVRELRRTLDTVLDACPADTITLLLLRGDPGLTRHIERWQQKHSG